MTNKTIHRRSDVVTRVEGDETLVLDTLSNTAHCLSGDVAAVWNATGGSVAAVATAAGLTPHAVEAALSTLDDLGLVAAPSGLSRRTLVTRGAVVGGAVVAAGAISMPLPAAAATISQDGFQVNGSCSGDFATFTIEPTGTKGVLAKLSPYVGTLVYESWENNTVTYETVNFNMQTNGVKVFSASPAPGGTDTGATIGVTPGGPGGSGSITVTTTKPFTGIYSLPTGVLSLNGPVPPTGHGFGGSAGITLNGSSSGNVYLQFLPSNAGDPTWSGYFNVTGCVVFAPGSHPPIAWPPPTT